MTIPTVSISEKSTGSAMSCESLMSDLLITNSSTSKLLEDISEKKLNVEVVSQKVALRKNKEQLVRVAKLFFESPDSAVMFCVSIFPINVLNDSEIVQLRAGDLPIGKIFGVDNIYKSRISVQNMSRSKLAKQLNVTDKMLFHKGYTIHTNGRTLGTIIEIFNKETINRIWL